ncbi:transketolase [Candidatus Woesearchaeota archaeon]|nr:transketolase [Candidatus Woesearchaeota archaeon]
MAGIKQLEIMADKLRIHSLESTTEAGSGHPTSCLSCAEIMSSLFFSELTEHDEFILSKGHAAPILWASYAEAGAIPLSGLNTLRKIYSNLEGHPTARMPWVKVATGSLGQGLAAGVGMAFVKKVCEESGTIYVLMGDGECAEGSVWESANIASYYKLNNLCAIVDINRLGQSQQTMHGYDLKAYEKKFRAFGWETKIIEGNSVKEILSAFSMAKKSKKPFVILAKTVKGKGVSFLENQEGWHGKALNADELERAVWEIGRKDITLSSKIASHKIVCKSADFRINSYQKGEEISTREAFGRALLNLGETNKNVMVIDGDVKNSTKTEYFFKEFPKSSIESFIAEQNMVGMAIGISAMGLVPFVSTFSCFLSRAHDFIRMAQYSNANIKFVGSHAGVSIGSDGPSQMGLEDISMFLSMPDSVILYPCDAVSAENLTKEMLSYKGISYLRTTRKRTKVIYSNNEKFRIGGLKVLKRSSKDNALVIAAGITVHEALKAYEELKKKRVSIRVIDLYSVKPFDVKSLLKNAKECKNKVVVVEDHYLGGIGNAIAPIIGKIEHLYIKKLPRSGEAEELMKEYRIDSSAIVKKIMEMK